LARRLGLTPAEEELLACAARWHDEGKRAAVWQRAFHAPSNGVYAKTPGPIDQNLLAGYRHELGSVLRIQRDTEAMQQVAPEHRDLLLHLIASHHGWARPWIPTEGPHDLPPSALADTLQEIALRYARLQQEWGPWGLAYWEALLRAADQQASRDNVWGTERGEAHGVRLGSSGSF
jgi:CRISPR-associated endonuclease/helicase Cas3